MITQTELSSVGFFESLNPSSTMACGSGGGSLTATWGGKLERGVVKDQDPIFISRGRERLCTGICVGTYETGRSISGIKPPSIGVATGDLVHGNGDLFLGGNIGHEGVLV